MTSVLSSPGCAALQGHCVPVVDLLPSGADAGAGQAVDQLQGLDVAQGPVLQAQVVISGPLMEGGRAAGSGLAQCRPVFSPSGAGERGPRQVQWPGTGLFIGPVAGSW